MSDPNNAKTGTAAKRANGHNKTERNLISRFFLFLINTLTVLGYVLIYPFEHAYKFIKILLLKGITYINELRLKPFSLRDIFLYISKKFRFLRNSLLWIQANLEVRKKKRQNKQKKKDRDKKLKKKEKTRRKNQKKSTSKVKLFLIFWLGGIFSILFFAVPVAALVWLQTLPSPELLQDQTQNSTTKILDRNGRPLYEIYIDKKYDPVPLKRVPDHVINATIAIEDASFYTHPGFDLMGIARALRSNVLHDDLQGGSTITQQLIKNVLLSSERTYSRKVKEVVLAVRVEHQYTKSQILEFYLNNIPYGGTAYGVQSASQKYFAKDVWDLNLSEASMLAGLPSAPSVYSPLDNFELAKQRQRQVLERMVELGYINRFEAENAYAQEITLAPQIEYIRAPHFVNFVRSELYKKYGQRAVDFGGLTVTTTLDLDLQDKVQSIVTDEVITNGERLGFSNGASVVLDSKTGQILAYVGSIDYFAGEEGNFDVVTAYRQPGSSIKPVTYALALEKGYTAASIIDDSPITYQIAGSPQYVPKNYDGKYHGKVPLRQALANSYNITAVKLVNAVGVDNMVQLGRNMGLNNWIVGDGTYGMSITLGGKEVRLIDLTNLYATFAREGKYRESTPFLSIKDIYGYDVLGTNGGNERQVLSEETAYIISNILSDNNARTPAFGPRSQLYMPDKTVAVKTGTTNDIRDNLTVGYTPTYSVGVWVGNNDNTVMNPNLASGLTGAAPIWNKIMTTILEDERNEEFRVPDGIVVKKDSSCAVKQEVFNKEHNVPDKICVTVKSEKSSKDKKDKKRE